MVNASFLQNGQVNIIDAQTETSSLCAHFTYWCPRSVLNCRQDVGPFAILYCVRKTSVLRLGVGSCVKHLLLYVIPNHVRVSTFSRKPLWIFVQWVILDSIQPSSCSYLVMVYCVILHQSLCACTCFLCIAWNVRFNLSEMFTLLTIYCEYVKYVTLLCASNQNYTLYKKVV